MVYNFKQFYIEILEIKKSNIPIADTLIFGICKEYHKSNPKELTKEDLPSLSQLITPYFQYPDITLTYDKDDPRVKELTIKARSFAQKLFTQLHKDSNENVRKIGEEGLKTLCLI